jgi:hypothetical protein
VKPTVLAVVAAGLLITAPAATASPRVIECGEGERWFGPNGSVTLETSCLGDSISVRGQAIDSAADPRGMDVILGWQDGTQSQIRVHNGTRVNFNAARAGQSVTLNVRVA